VPPYRGTPRVLSAGLLQKSPVPVAAQILGGLHPEEVVFLAVYGLVIFVCFLELCLILRILKSAFRTIFDDAVKDGTLAVRLGGIGQLGDGGENFVFLVVQVLFCIKRKTPKPLGPGVFLVRMTGRGLLRNPFCLATQCFAFGTRLRTACLKNSSPNCFSLRQPPS